MLTGKNYSARLASERAQIDELRRKHGDIENWCTDVLDSASNASPLPKPDLSAELHRAKESLRTWKRLIAEGKVESLIVQLPATPGSDQPVRMLSVLEQEQLRATKKAFGAYVERILNITPIK
ncbi:MAG: hypothetical protein ABW069_14670 [Duganella sp.]